MTKKTKVKKGSGGSASKTRGGVGSSTPKHSLPAGFWPQITALMFIALAVILVLAMLGMGGSFPAALFKGFRQIIGLVAFVVPLIIVYLALKKMFSEGTRLALGMHLGFIAFMVLGGGMLATLFSADAMPENAGGEVGKAIKDTLVGFMHPVAAFFLLLILTLVSIMFIFKLQPKKVLAGLGGLFRSSGEPRVKDIKSKNDDVGVKLGDGGLGKLKLNRGVETEDEDEMLKPAKSEGVSKMEIKPSFKERLNGIKVGMNPNTDAGVRPGAERDIKIISPGSNSSKGDFGPLGAKKESYDDWKFPGVDILENKVTRADAGDISANARIIKETLHDFKIDVEMEEANVGPRVTQYAMKPPAGVKLSKIVELDTNLALNLAASTIRIEAPIPGKKAVGIEVPNKKSASVNLRSLLESREWKEADSPLSFAIGKDIAGESILGALDGMPHLLVAGQTGSGKSVMINTLIISLLYRNSPSDLKLILVDPKQVELAPYNGIAHLLTPVIIEPEKALSALKWAVNEMERRYSLLAEHGTRNIKGYNAMGLDEKLPYIVIIIDELADLMMVAARDVEGLIVRIAQKARAVGIHLVLATQRPSVNVVTGLIKANVPARIAFTVASQVDSRTIIDQMGAEKLLGQGDLLMTTAQMPKPKRVQAVFISDNEVNEITASIKAQRPPDYNNEIIAQPVQINDKGGVVFDSPSGDGSDDDLFKDAVSVSIQAGKASASLLQRRLRVGYARAARLIEEMEENGIVGPADGARPRDVLISDISQMNGGGGSGLAAGASSDFGGSASPRAMEDEFYGE